MGMSKLSQEATLEKCMCLVKNVYSQNNKSFLGRRYVIRDLAQKQTGKPVKLRMGRNFCVLFSLRYPHYLKLCSHYKWIYLQGK